MVVFYEKFKTFMESKINRNVADPVKTRQGQLSIRAYRLSTKALEMSLDGDWSPER